jgi:hypothetical protein
MANKDSRSGFSSSAGDGESFNAQKLAEDAFSKVSDVMDDATKKAKEQASSAASSVADHLKGLLDQQVGGGADMVGHFASAVKSAADDLDQNAPAFGSVVRGLADKIDDFADDIRDQSAEELFHKASDVTRQRPALVFGLAALAGFFAFRTLKNTTSVVAAPSIQPERGSGDRAGRSHG